MTNFKYTLPENKTIDFKTLFLTGFSSSWLADTLNFYLQFPFGLLSTFFNLFSLIIFYRIKFKNSLYKYLQVYTASSLIIAITQMFFFTFSAYLIFEISSSYVVRIFRCYIVSSYVTIFLFFYSNALDVIINIERIIKYSNKYEKFSKISPYIVCFILFIICFIISIPNMMAQDMVSDQDLSIKLHYCVPSAFH